MADFSEHLAELEKSGSIALIEDPTNEIKRGFDMVRFFISRKILTFEADVKQESLKGAANIARINTMTAMVQEYHAFASQLEHILFVDHKHDEPVAEEVEEVSDAPVPLPDDGLGKVIEDPRPAEPIPAPAPVVITVPAEEPVAPPRRGRPPKPSVSDDTEEE